MSGDELGVAVQRQLAERVAEVVEDIARALESAPWADEGPYAADAAALVRTFAVDGSPGFRREASSGTRHSGANGRKPVDAYLIDQTTPSSAPRGRQHVSTEETTDA